MKKTYIGIMIPYNIPRDWIRYNSQAVLQPLAEAKAAILALRSIPYQKEWVESLQAMELKREVAGTSRIEGADFTDAELDRALGSETTEGFITRSQKQVRAALRAYRWIVQIPDNRHIDASLLREIHEKIVVGADDDHCLPGMLRGEGSNVSFGSPRHSGAVGGRQVEEAFQLFEAALQREYPRHDGIIQALAAHYHFAAIHPFLDGNGRTARALEALLLQRAGLRDTCFVAMSNYYYDEKPNYLATLSDVRANGHDLTSFLLFGLHGIVSQANRMLGEIKVNMQKALCRHLMGEMTMRLKSPRKRVIAERQGKILNLLLSIESMELGKLIERTEGIYAGKKNPTRALIRDLNALISLKSITYTRQDPDKITFKPNLDWPAQMSETEFFTSIMRLPRAKTTIMPIPE